MNRFDLSAILYDVRDEKRQRATFREVANRGIGYITVNLVNVRK